MKRYDCTLSDKRGAFGDCMEAHSTGRYVLFSDVEKLQRRMQDLLDKSNRTGVAIERAISTGSVLASLHQGRPDTEWTDAATSPVAADYRELQVQHDQVQSRLKGALDLLQEAHEVMRRNVPNSPQGFANRADILDRIEAELAGRVKGRTITEGQKFELTTVLQSIANGFSDDPAHDAASMLKRIAGEVQWTGDSFQLPPRQGGEPCASEPPSSSPA